LHGAGYALLRLSEAMCSNGEALHREGKAMLGDALAMQGIALALLGAVSRRQSIAAPWLGDAWQRVASATLGNVATAKHRGALAWRRLATLGDALLRLCGALPSNGKALHREGKAMHRVGYAGHCEVLCSNGKAPQGPA